MGNTDRRGPDISDEWLETSDVDSNSGRPLKVAVIGAGVAGLGKGTTHACGLRAMYDRGAALLWSCVCCTLYAIILLLLLLLC